MFSTFDWKESPNDVINRFVDLSKTEYTTHVPLPLIRGDDQYYVASYNSTNYQYTIEELQKAFDLQQENDECYNCGSTFTSRNSSGELQCDNCGYSETE